MICFSRSSEIERKLQLKQEGRSSVNDGRTLLRAINASEYNAEKLMILCMFVRRPGKNNDKISQNHRHRLSLAVNNGWKVPIFKFKSRNNRLEPKFEIFFATIYKTIRNLIIILEI